MVCLRRTGPAVGLERMTMDENKVAHSEMALVLAQALTQLDNRIEDEKRSLAAVRKEAGDDHSYFGTVENAMQFFGNWELYIANMVEKYNQGVALLDEVIEQGNLSMNDLKKAMNKQIEEYEKENN